MQSFLQYRRFRDAARAQLERDRERSEGGSTQSNARNGDDLEKGDERDHPVDGVQSDTPTSAEDDSGKSPPDLEPVEDKYEDDQIEEDEDDFELGLNAHSTLSRTTTQQSAATALGLTLSGIEVRRRTTREGGEGNVFVVGYESPDDPNDPHNWSTWRRLGCTVPLAGIGAVVGFASAVDSPAIPQAAEEFGVSEVVESLATGLFLIGFGAGALFAGPVSETVGRNPVYIGTLSLFMIFIMASGLAPNIGAQLAFRFIAGVFGSTPLTCAGGSISDLWSPLERGITFPIFANAVCRDQM